MDKDILCLIFARGGSARVPAKNIKPLGGVPLLAHSIACARKSRRIRRIIVSTDDEAIAEAARRYGAETPFMRPGDISGPTSTDLEAYVHALDWLRDHEGYRPEVCVLLRVTAPFRKVETLDRAIDKFLAHPEADSLRGVRKCSEHPHKMWRVRGDWLESFVPLDRKERDAHNLAYQQLPEVQIQNANIEITRPETIYGKRSITGDRILAWPMDDLESVDINTPVDFMFAEFLLERGLVRTEHEEPPVIIDEDLERYAPYLGEPRPCEVCGGWEKEPWAAYGSFRAVRCRVCGLVWVDPFVREEGLARYYADYIGMRFKDEKKTRQRAAQYELDKAFIEKYVGGGRVLDVGCSGGFFLAALSPAFEKFGLELDAEAVRYAREHYDFGPNVRRLALHDADFPDGSFDLVVMRGVIEHLPEPRQAVSDAARLLKPGGFFLVAATPNVESFSAGLYREKWNQFHPLRHLYYFSARSLARLCADHGLSLAAEHYPYLETPYADPPRDIRDVGSALAMKEAGAFARVGRSPAFWENMMNLAFRKA